MAWKLPPSRVMWHQMFVLTILTLLPSYGRTKANTKKCSSKESFLVPHEWYQPGKFLIGGIVSHILNVYFQYTFDDAPSKKLNDELPLSNMGETSSFYHTVSNEGHQYTGIISLLKHFGWIWVGLLAADDESGDRFLKKLESLFLQNKICSAFVQRMPVDSRFPGLDELSTISANTKEFYSDLKVNVLVVY
ncbi:hypothetical protein E2320_003520, partial [Naja naja]